MNPRRRRTMRNVKLGAIALVLVMVASVRLAGAQGKPQPRPGTQPGAAQTQITATTPEQVLKEVEQTFGFVPQIFRLAPDAMLVGFWASFKGLQLNPGTKLDNKTKELIGLAVAAQIPC